MIKNKTKKKTKKKTNNSNNKISQKLNLTISNKTNSFVKLADIINGNIDNEEKTYHIKEYFKFLIDNNKSKEYEKHFVSFSKKKQGRSGAVIGYLDNNPNIVVKKNTYSRININSIIKYNKCLFLNEKFNELVINNILSKPQLFEKFTKKELKLYNRYILKIKDSYISDKGSNKGVYLLFPLIGYQYENFNHTNLEDILIHNHLPIIKEMIIKNDTKSLNLYDNFLSDYIFVPYIKTLKILQNKFKYVNSDLKLDNIFIKKTKNNNSKYNKLRLMGIIVDIIPLFADFDKVSVTVNDLKIISTTSNFKKIFMYLSNDIIGKVRHKCKTDIGIELCNKFSIYDFDLLTILFSIYITIYQTELKYKVKIIETLDHLKKLFIKHLKLSDSDFQSIIKIIRSSSIKKNTRISFHMHIGWKLKSFCKRNIK